MATNVIMPALEMAQETGKILRWLKAEGAVVKKGEPIMEIETDKVTVEIEAPASGILTDISAREGESVPVGQAIARVVAPGEQGAPAPQAARASGKGLANPGAVAPGPAVPATPAALAAPGVVATSVSPLARKIAAEHGIDLARVKPNGGRIEKADVLAYLASASPSASSGGERRTGLLPASPKARQLAAERGFDLAGLQGSGPDGAVLAADVPASLPSPTPDGMTTIWRVMAERVTASWTTVPHFYLTREIDASGLVELRRRVAPVVERQSRAKPTYTDLLVKLIAVALRDHPRVNAAWVNGRVRLNDEINIGLATAVEDGLIVPVIHRADTITLGAIAQRRHELIERADRGQLKPADIAQGTFTLTNLGMYNVDAFNAIIHAPQAAILAVGRIADRVIAVAGQPAVRPTMVVTLACDHRVVDGARAAQFLDDVAKLIEEPLGLLAKV